MTKNSSQPMVEHLIRSKMDFNSKYKSSEIEELLDKVDTLATVATSGSYNDLLNKPKIPDISGKQDKLVSGTNIKTINGTSILGSGDITISEGGGSSSGSAAYPEVNHGTSDVTFELTPNAFHIWEEVGSLTLTLGSETAGVANEFLFQFNSGSEATLLGLPEDIKWADGLIVEPNRIYQVSILKGLASVLSWENTPTVKTISFSIRAMQCIAEEGMTWEQWVSSSYNTVNCTIMGVNISRYGELIGLDWSTPVVKTDAIISDTSYITIPMT